jgi:hypothetical protein
VQCFFFAEILPLGDPKKIVSLTSAKHFLGNNLKNSPYFEEKKG